MPEVTSLLKPGVAGDAAEAGPSPGVSGVLWIDLEPLRPAQTKSFFRHFVHLRRICFESLIFRTLRGLPLRPHGASDVRISRFGFSESCCIECWSPAGVDPLATEEFHWNKFFSAFFSLNEICGKSLKSLGDFEWCLSRDPGGVGRAGFAIRIRLELLHRELVTRGRGSTWDR